MDKKSTLKKAKLNILHGKIDRFEKRKFLDISAFKKLGKSNDYLLCKICLQLFSEPFSTLCGHTFCQSCIEQHLAQNSRCPICDTALDPKKTRVIPNHTVAVMLGKLMTEGTLERIIFKQEKSKDDGEAILEMLLNTNLDSSILARISGVVESKRLEMEVNAEFLRNLILYEFLEKMIEKREKQAEHVQIQLDRLKADKQKISEYLNKRAASYCAAETQSHRQQQRQLRHNRRQQNHQQHQRVVPDVARSGPPTNISIAPPDVCDAPMPPSTDGSMNMDMEESPSMSTAVISSNRTRSTVHDIDSLLSSLRVRDELGKFRKRLMKHMDSLEFVYFNPRKEENGALVGSCATLELEDFSQVIYGMTQYGYMKRLSTINYNVEASSPHSIVSSIEFDKDGEYFAVAGVTKVVKIYDFNLAVEFSGDNPYPTTQLQCNAKISNVSWNPYSKNLMATSDYDGTVQLWDTNVARATRNLREHERRCWTVQFNNVDPHLMASGSDDSKVKLWNVMMPQSLCTIDAKANVCCVNFSPQSKNYLVFGSADHCVHLYDIRNPSKALSLFCGHRKAVSYVKYCNEFEVISASTDGDLRIWNVNSYKCLRILRGHQNERNFCGLTTDGSHVMCGSETNHIYLYYKNIVKPLMCFDFNVKSTETLMEPKQDASNVSSLIGGGEHSVTKQQSLEFSDFVSTVCWKKNSNIIVAANSQGTTHILQLQ